jgi:anti-sigma B factor antagonist
MGDNANSEPARNGHKPPLEVAVCSGPARSWVTLTGDLDLVSAPQLQRVLDQLCRDGCSEVVVDLTGLDFLGAVGLGVLLRADDQLRATGARLILYRPPRGARRILAITELDTVLTIRSGELAPSRPHDH